jgi:hypothetical protein
VIRIGATDRAGNQGFTPKVLKVLPRRKRRG